MDPVRQKDLKPVDRLGGGVTAIERGERVGFWLDLGTSVRLCCLRTFAFTRA